MTMSSRAILRARAGASLVTLCFAALLFGCFGCATSSAPSRLSQMETALRARAPHPGPVLFVMTAAAEQTLAGVVVPGGQGVMVDLLEDRDLHALLLRFGETARPVGLICHAPALLTRLPAGAGPFRGRTVTSVSGIEELFIETFIMGDEARNRAIGRTLEAHGFRYESAFPGNPFAVRDCNLVTSQNPYSGEEFGVRYLQALDAHARRERCGGPPSASALSAGAGM